MPAAAVESVVVAIASGSCAVAGRSWVAVVSMVVVEV